MSLPVTSMLAGFLALVLVVLSARVIGARQAAPDDEAGSELVTRRVRGQANFCEYVPLALMLFALAELQGFNTVVLAVLAALFAFARVIHGYAFAFTDYWKFGRLYGTGITFTVIALMGAITFIMGVLNIGG